MPLIPFLTTFLLVSEAISQQVTFKKTDLDSPPQDLIWCGNTREVIFIQTESSHVYKSTDGGQTWIPLNDEFTQAAKVEQENPKDKIGKVSSMQQSPVDKSLIVMIGTQGFSWIVEECGKKVRAIFQGRPINEWIFHPTERNWALVTAYSLCEDYINEPCRIVKELYVTLSLGNDWKILGDYIHSFNWGVISKNMINKGVPKERILVTYQAKGHGDQKDEKRKYSYKIDFVYSDDFFNSKVVGVRKGNKFLLTEDYLFVSQVLEEEKQEVQLLNAKSTDKRYDFSPIVTNQKSFKDHSYTFLDTSEDMVFLFINNFGASVKFGNIYASGDKGRDFSLSLKNNIQVRDGDNDFENVKSVDGVYLANAISGKYMKLAKQEVMQQLKEQKLAQKKGQNTKKLHLTINYMNYAKTLITHNKGGDWKRLTAPQLDSNGNAYDCKDYCYLHLYSYSSEIPQFYAVDNAPGLIIGNGMVGRYIDYEYHNVGLFLSRDGGITWYEIKKGVYIYEIGDHGGLLVIAKYELPTKTVYYSYDEGLSWEELEISDYNISIKNILIEPAQSSQHFLVYGIRKTGDGESKGIVINLDFSTLKMPICTKSDYEIWTPRSITAKNQNECLLGRKVSYMRRKRDSKCLNGEGFERKITVEICSCTEDDYQCDIGYHRNEPGDPCTPISNEQNITKNAPPEICEGYYTISRGYRKIAGNFCKGGVNFDPIKVACPYNKFFYAIKLIFYILIIFAVFGGIYFLFINSGIDWNDIMKGLKSLKPDIVITGKVPQNYLNIDNIDEDNTLFDNDDENNEKKDVVDSGQPLNNVNMESKNDEKDEDKKQLKS